MPVQELARTTDVDLVRALERHIVRRTWRRIRRLQVERAGGRVVVRGCTASYYLKQLALQAVLEVARSTPVELDIQVTGSVF